MSNNIEQYLNEDQVNSMTGGIFNNNSYHGMKSSVLKSAICKYFRREMFDKFEWCCIEMSLFSIKSTALTTNLVNRLYILLMEEICCNSTNLVDALLVLNSIRDETDSIKRVQKIKVFCNIVNKSKKGRICSYVNNWWKFHNMEANEKNEISLVLQYKKNGDDDSILLVGENLIHYIEDNDEKIFDCYNKLYQIEAKVGNRYRRTDAVYLYWEIMESYLNKNENTRKLFHFGLEMFHRKTMKERKAFGIWIGLLVLNRNSLNYTNCIDVTNIGSNIDIENTLKNHGKIDVNEDFVVNDWHVNRNYGKEKFAKIGSYVVNECTDLLGDNFDNYKSFYIAKKTEEDSIGPKKRKIEKKEKVEKTGKKRKTESNEDEIQMIGFYESFRVIKMIHDGVCGMKKPCIIVEDLENKETFVIKEMSVNGMKKGLDYAFVDSLKKDFGLVDLKMERFKSLVGIVLKDKNIRQYKNNCELGHLTEPVYFCKMKFIPNHGDLSKKDVLNNMNIKKQMLIIRLFDGLFRSSDNNMRNILIGENNMLISIDEGDIFGKRKNIFEKYDWCKKDEWCRNNIEDVVKKCIFGEGRKELVINRLIDYGYPNEMVTEFTDRYDNYVNIVNEDFGI